MSFEVVVTGSCLLVFLLLITIFGGSILLGRQMDRGQGAQNAEINKSITFYRNKRGW